MGQQNFTIFNYVDDLMGIGPVSTVHTAYSFLLNLLEKLGFPISISKLESPSTKGNCLGVIADTIASTFSVTDKKLTGILDKCNSAYNKENLTKRELQSITGSFMFIAKCVKPTRFFVNRLLEGLRKANNDKRIPVTESIRRDLNWFNTFLLKFNGTAKYVHTNVNKIETLAKDACLQGVPTPEKNYIYAAALPSGLRNNVNLSITNFEMINIIVVIKLWGSDWSHQKVILKTNNMAGVNICNSGYTRDQYLASIIRNIWLLTSEYDICLKVVHIAGKQNIIADLLSRWKGTPSQREIILSYKAEHQWYKGTEQEFYLNPHI